MIDTVYQNVITEQCLLENIRVILKKMFISVTGFTIFIAVLRTFISKENSCVGSG